MASPPAWESPPPRRREEAGSGWEEAVSWWPWPCCSLRNQSIFAEKKRRNVLLQKVIQYHIGKK